MRGEERHNSLEAEDAAVLDSSFMKRGTEQPEEGSSGAGGSWTVEDDVEEASGMDFSGRSQSHDEAIWDEAEEQSHGSSEGAPAGVGLGGLQVFEVPKNVKIFSGAQEKIKEFMGEV
ncbi:hypothetical protein TRIUR3_24144 [Triticum urartu]|uniref:Uncharacterized protein n=1 Tax=Triticum urartu TaxID=4572 RepID=M7Y7B1_TRIUA|nr:hypothetical protein TRIUR3_24144 [Triticum urartu]